MKIIGYIHTDFPTKFGVPRQSGLSQELKGEITFLPEYKVAEAFRGIEGFSHIWVIWQFSESITETFSPTVRPPRLGGKRRVGVFASRAPYRPNPIAISCVKLESVRYDKSKGTVLTVSGIDMANNTPIYDIKPYIPLTDCHPEATEGYTAETKIKRLSVCFPKELRERAGDSADAIEAFLEGDPRPAFENAENKIYKVAFSHFDVSFSVCEDKLTVVDVKSI
ncbi:MAG: tRNA (N6-threonylcarbamoyladenosine(37)-N6)-methyltransferase TrmO [Clostridia bacterium]|nr:tRNA (N6-threonylcarbamoyladenosine(37)-N6)-methyltransferase TrmO [Clostridia bacterium]